MRKNPTQLRAKQRVEGILDATEALIIEDGVANLGVNDIAARAGVPVGSLYQYFQNRDEVLRALCDRYYKVLADSTADCFTAVTTIGDFITDLREALQLCWSFTQRSAGYRRLFFDVQAWEVLREVDLEDTFLNAQRMQKSLLPLLPNTSSERVLALCVLIGDTASNAARLAARFTDLREELFAELIAMVESRLYAMLVTGSRLRFEPAV